MSDSLPGPLPAATRVSGAALPKQRTCGAWRFPARTVSPGAAGRRGGGVCRVQIRHVSLTSSQGFKRGGLPALCALGLAGVTQWVRSDILDAVASLPHHW